MLVPTPDGPFGADPAASSPTPDGPFGADPAASSPTPDGPDTGGVEQEHASAEHDGPDWRDGTSRPTWWLLPAALLPAASLRMAAPNVHWMFHAAIAGGVGFVVWATRATTRRAVRIVGLTAFGLATATAIASSGTLPDRTLLFFLEHPLFARALVGATLLATVALALTVPLSRQRRPEPPAAPSSRPPAEPPSPPDSRAPR
jgi:hypothetical protein